MDPLSYTMEGSRNFVFHYRGEWREGRVGKAVDYLNGLEFVADKMDGEYTTLFTLKTLVEETAECFKTAAFKLCWVSKSGKMEELVSDGGVLRMWNECEVDEQGYMHVFVVESMEVVENVEKEEMRSTSLKIRLRTRTSRGVSEIEEAHAQTLRAEREERAARKIRKVTVKKVPDGELHTGMMWQDFSECRAHLRKYAIMNKFELAFVKNDGSRIRAKCRAEGCPWVCNIRKHKDGHSAKMRKMVAVHTCDRDPESKNKLANAPWVAKSLEEKIKMNYPAYTPKDIQNEMWDSFKVRISYYIAWHARSIALKNIFGTYGQKCIEGPERQFEDLPLVLKRGPGRPKLVTEDEGSREPKQQKTCKKCGYKGHNTRTCKGLSINQGQGTSSGSEVLPTQPQSVMHLSGHQQTAGAPIHPSPLQSYAPPDYHQSLPSSTGPIAGGTYFVNVISPP